MLGSERDVAQAIRRCAAENRKIAARKRVGGFQERGDAAGRYAFQSVAIRLDNRARRIDSFWNAGLCQSRR